MPALRYATGKTLLMVAYPVLVYFGLSWFDARERGFANFFLFVPSLLNFVLLTVFLSSITSPPSIAEKFACVLVKDLQEEEIRYCRKVTLVWCVFFVGNGSLATGLAVYASLEVWTAYNGIIAYCLMGTLFISEFLYRHWRFRRYVGTPFDPFLRRIFPPVNSDGC